MWFQSQGPEAREEVGLTPGVPAKGTSLNLTPGRHQTDSRNLPQVASATLS